MKVSSPRFSGLRIHLAGGESDDPGKSTSVTLVPDNDREAVDAFLNSHGKSASEVMKKQLIAASTGGDEIVLNGKLVGTHDLTGALSKGLTQGDRFSEPLLRQMLTSILSSNAIDFSSGDPETVQTFRDNRVRLLEAVEQGQFNEEVNPLTSAKEPGIWQYNGPFKIKKKI